MVTSPPVFTDTVNQQFFIEAQGGAQNPTSLLDRFPDNLYTKSVDSSLVKFLYALLGPVGVGQLRTEYLEARLQFEDANLSVFDLDTLYTNPFAFARLAEETYEFDASASLLSTADRARILQSDASFRNRAIDYFKGIRAGGTLRGLSLIAKSGLNRPVELIENYRALWDQYTDIPLGIPFMGSTVDANEVVVLPRQDIPRNTQQILTLTGNPTSGWFTLILPTGPARDVVTIGVANGSSIATVPNASQIAPGTYLNVTTVTSATLTIGQTAPTTFLMAGSAQSPTSIQLLYPPTNLVNAGQPFVWSLSTNTYWAYVGNAETVPIPFNASALAIQTALQALPIIGVNNISATGGPLPDQPVTLEFRNQLGDQPMPAIQPNIVAGTVPFNGIGGPSATAPLVPELTDVLNNPLTIDAVVTVDVAGVSSDSQTIALRPADEHAMQVALDGVRPQTSFFTTTPASGVTQRQPINKVFAGSSYTEVLRYEIGNSRVAWPADATHWIQGGVEREAPRPVTNLQSHYQNFHNIVNVTAYTEAALNDPNYLAGTANLTQYWDVMIGRFSPVQVALFPFLSNYQDPTVQYSATQAVAISDPLVITQSVNGVGVIDDIYPRDYVGLSSQLAAPIQTFWSSLERAPGTDGSVAIDYLEIDLGHTQAVNYIYFEATRKPYDILVDYDLLDQGPMRRFMPTTIDNSIGTPSITQLTYDATMANPWQVVTIHCTNGLGQMLYTRFVRLGFIRNPGNTPFAPNLSPVLPYSIEIRNLRIGRNISNFTP